MYLKIKKCTDLFALAIPKFYHPKAILQTWLCHIPLGWDAQWYIKSEKTRFKHQRPQTAAF
jgi:hypothetical protein